MKQIVLEEVRSRWALCFNLDQFKPAPYIRGFDPLLTPDALIANTALSNYAQQRKNIYFIDPYDSFCDDNACRAIADNKVLYSDGGHLSKDGSRFFIKSIQKKLLDTLG